tara:strand:- start:354 stop:1655 length:1302 start_codon:yes stop_codon:yes gene_type:complete
MGSKPSKSSGGGGPGDNYQKAIEKIYGSPKKKTSTPSPFASGQASVAAMSKPMGPGQSMAMAGNTGLAGLSENQVNQIVGANKQLNKIFDGNRPDTFQQLGQTFGEVGSKYRRSADREKYAKNMQKISEGLAAGATPFIGQDGIERLSFTNLGLKDEEGRTILSKQLPGVTATAPTLGQLGGDIGRAFTGYNSLQYTDPTSNVPQMVKTQGLADVLAKAAIPGSTAFRIIQDLYGKGKDFFFPTEEEEDEVDIFSSGADATGGAFTIPQSLVPRDIPMETLPGITTGIGGGLPVDRVPVSDLGPTTLGRVPQTFVFPTSSRPPGLDSSFPGMGETTVSPEEDKPKVLDLREIMSGGGGNQDGEDGSQQQTTPDDPPTDPSEYEALTRRYLQLAGFSQQEIDRIMTTQGYMMGGLIPPESGPMSEGVASLFKNK